MNKLTPLSHIGELSTGQFLRDYWQKQHLLVKNAFPDFESPIDANELAGLALEDEVSSRLIVEKARNRWTLQHGPLEESLFATLPESHWTLLVQNVDVLDENVNALLSAFRFVPNWRLDDIMISYAADQGSVGPHFDYYDVFLLQAQGTRRWQIGQQCDANTPLLPDQEMKILADFTSQAEYVLEPGDMLYIPPGLAHWGIAKGECMTISVGFRAPSHAELLLEVAQELASELSEDQRYTDPGLQGQHNPGEIATTTIDVVCKTLTDLIQDKQKIAEIFGKLMTQKNNDLAFAADTNETGNDYFRLVSGTRCAYFGEGEIVSLFVNGEQWRCSIHFAEVLSRYNHFRENELIETDKNVFKHLLTLHLIEKTGR